MQNKFVEVRPLDPKHTSQTRITETVHDAAYVYFMF